MARVALGLLLFALSAPVEATTITILNVDGAGEGFNDPTPVAPVGGNPGATLGAQRLNVFQYAAAIWATALVSPVEIRVRASFDPFACSGSNAILGFGGALGAYRDFVGAPLPGTWYPAPLASALAGVDIDGGSDDIQVMFNTAVGGGGSCPFDFYYGLDASPPASTPGHAVSDLASVVLHELGHGLGFGSLVDVTTGQKALGFDDTYMLNVENHTTGTLFPAMTDAERLAAIVDTGDLHWAGPAVVAASGILSVGREPSSGHVLLFAPGTVQEGSTLNHFDNGLVPNQVMEAYYAGAIHDPGLALQVMQDLGWTVITLCGNGMLDGSEQCDDGNTAAGDGCSPVCRLEGCVVCTGEPSVCTPCATDHYMCDKAAVNAAAGGTKFDKASLPQRSLQDQFGSETCTFKIEDLVCNPAEKNGEGPPSHPAIHQVSYKLFCPTKFTKQTGVLVVDQVNPNGVTVDVLKKVTVLVPSGKTDLGPTPPPPPQTPPATAPPLTVDHFLCYKVKGPSYKKSLVAVTVTDQFYPAGYPGLTLVKMTKLCTPVNMANEDPTAPNHAEHLACYQATLAKGTVFSTRTVVTNNTDLGANVLAVKSAGELCVPALKNP